MMAVLAGNAFRPSRASRLLFVVAALLAATSSLQRPSREALEPRTVRHDQITAANALSQLRHAGGRAARPGHRRRAHRLAWGSAGASSSTSSASGRRLRPVRRDAALPPPRRDDAPEPARHRRGMAVRRRSQATCSAPTSSTSSRCCSRCRSCSSRRWRPRSSSAPSCSDCSTPRRPSAPSSRPRSAAGPRASTTTDGPSSSPPRRTAPASRSPASRRSFGVALVCFAMAGAADMISAVFRGDGVEPDHPRAHARPAGRHRDAVLLRRPAGWPGPRGLRGRRLVGAWLDRLRRCRVRRRGAADRGGAAGLLAYDNRTDVHAIAERERRGAET